MVASCASTMMVEDDDEMMMANAAGTIMEGLKDFIFVLLIDDVVGRE